MHAAPMDCEFTPRKRIRADYVNHTARKRHKHLRIASEKRQTGSLAGGRTAMVVVRRSAGSSSRVERYPFATWTL